MQQSESLQPIYENPYRSEGFLGYATVLHVGGIEARWAGGYLTSVTVRFEDGRIEKRAIRSGNAPSKAT